MTKYKPTMQDASSNGSEDNNSHLSRDWCSDSTHKVFYREKFMLGHPSAKLFLLEGSPESCRIFV